ncbi:cation:proton antiporter [Caldimonas tepidiphila]|uniref:cation:proton antiporter n=1 Tax=Caldimonas tepidiphila TaxID=2315841 RepID=UPI001F0C076C|nr:cation:proton antiporter [Caldimonas tepidiphila]
MAEEGWRSAFSFMGAVMPWPPQPDALMLVSLALIAGALLGEAVFRGAGLPRVVGYSLAGLGISALGLGIPYGAPGGTLRLVIDLALALLLFELGARVRLLWLRTNPFLLVTSLVESLLSFVAVYLVARWLGTSPVAATALAVLSVPASPAVISRVASELRAAGQVTERIAVLAALNTLYGVMAARVLLGWLHLDHGENPVRAVLEPLYVFAVSGLLAGGLAYAVARVARKLDLRNENSTLLLLGLVAFALTLTQMFGGSTLLVPLMAGLWLRNTTDRPWVWPRHFGTAGGVLVLMLFVIVGSTWSLDGLMAGGLLALAAMLARLLAKGLAVFALGWASGQSPRQGLSLGLALTPLSATALVMLSDMQAAHAGFAAQIAPAVLSAIAVMELVGALAVQGALRLAGEVSPRRE